MTWKGNGKGKSSACMPCGPMPMYPMYNPWDPYGYGKSKGKGKQQGKAAQGSPGKGGSGTGGTCKCCGKTGHAKSDCHQRDKACHNCGIIGHQKHLCRHPLKTSEAKNDEANKKEEKVKEVWLCPDCHVFNPDVHVKKCKTAKCEGKQNKCTYKEAADKANTAVSKNSNKLMEKQDPQKLKQEYDARAEMILVLQADISRYDSKEWKSISSVETGHFKADLDKLLALQKEYEDDVDNLNVFTSLVGDQKRLNHNHMQRKKKLQEALDEKKEKKSGAKKRAEEMMEEEKERHAAEMAKLELHFNELDDHYQKELEDLLQQIKTEEEEYVAKNAEVGTAIAKESGPNVTAAFASSVITTVEGKEAEETVDQISVKIKESQTHLEVVDQLTDDQTKFVARSFAKMLDEYKKEMTEHMRKLLQSNAKAAGEEVPEAGRGGEDDFTTMQRSGKPSNRTIRRRTSEGHMLDDSDERERQQKRESEAPSSQDAQAKKLQMIEVDSQKEAA